MQKNSTFRKILQVGITSLLLATSLATLSESDVKTQSANLASDVSLGVTTDNLSIGVQTGGGSATQPGCDTTNCLTIPSTDSYKGITTLTGLREAILNWVNFALGFLALIAMIALIYAGFLYVTSMGEDEQSGKAKKIIIYVTIGIIIILLAYAFVNTLIEDGPTGSDLTSTTTTTTTTP
ncbi:MAG: hypothetical protein PHO48_00480 [Candidatus Gracilibacteria bacterium]|nr:hypothetical protein [Candidatus Gracilibacteria bacterium]MDD5178740.1 hypothetical protein [Candidatus Gracilibacteria bacterium]